MKQPKFALGEEVLWWGDVYTVIDIKRTEFKFLCFKWCVYYYDISNLGKGINEHKVTGLRENSLNKFERVGK